MTFVERPSITIIRGVVPTVVTLIICREYLSINNDLIDTRVEVITLSLQKVSISLSIKVYNKLAVARDFVNVLFTNVIYY